MGKKAVANNFKKAKHSTASSSNAFSQPLQYHQQPSWPQPAGQQQNWHGHWQHGPGPWQTHQILAQELPQQLGLPSLSHEAASNQHLSEEAVQKERRKGLRAQAKESKTLLTTTASIRALPRSLLVDGIETITDGEIDATLVVSLTSKQALPRLIWFLTRIQPTTKVHDLRVASYKDRMLLHVFYLCGLHLVLKIACHLSQLNLQSS